MKKTNKASKSLRPSGLKIKIKSGIKAGVFTTLKG